MDLVDVLQPQPLRGEPRAERLGARIGAACAGPASSSTRGVAELAAGWPASAVPVRRRAPEEERQARRQVDVADAVPSPRDARRGSRSKRKMKYGLARIASSAAGRRPRSRPSPRPARRTASAVDLARGHRPAVRLRRQAGEDLPRARPLSRPRGRPAREDLLAAGVSDTPVALDGPADDRGRAGAAAS